MVREWRRYQEPGQYARKGEGVVIVNMLLMVRDQNVLLQKDHVKRDQISICVEANT